MNTSTKIAPVSEPVPASSEARTVALRIVRELANQWGSGYGWSMLGKDGRQEKAAWVFMAWMSSGEIPPKLAAEVAAQILAICTRNVPPER